MRFRVLACDYDGTLATEGTVAPQTLAAMERFLLSGRKLVLVTGRQLDDLERVFHRLDVFEWVVAENGAMLYSPATRKGAVLAPPPPAEFVAALRHRHVPFDTGRGIVATCRPHEATVLDVIRETGLELQVIFNRDSVMVLPPGVNKATGLSAALKELGLALPQAVGVGDAENDDAFLRACGCGVAVQNAVTALRERVDLVTRFANGQGVVELIEELIASDLEEWEGQPVRHRR